LLSLLFEVEESTLWRERTLRMQPVLEQVLPRPMQDHLLRALETRGNGGNGGNGKRKRIGTLVELLEAYPELRDLVVDATQQQVPRPQRKTPQDKARHTQFYSGKSHCHAIKTQVTTAKRLILHVFGNTPARVHDRQLLRASGVLRALDQAASPQKTKVQDGRRPAQRTQRQARRVRLDKGYSGVEDEFGACAGVHLLASIKARRNAPLTLLQRLWNRVVVATQRIQVEQNIGHLQNWRVLSATYRARLSTHQDTFALVAGLHNFTQLGRLDWQK